MNEDVVSGAEFGRFRNDFLAFQDRLQRQIDTGFGGVHGRLDELNGRTRRNSEAIAVIDTRIGNLETEEGSVSAVVTNIRDHGCSQLENHTSVLQAANGGGPLAGYWTPKKKAAVGGGLLATGALIWPALEAIANAVHHALETLATLPK